MPVLRDCTLIMDASCCVAPLQKNAIAVAHCKKGKGVLNINGYPIDGLLPESMRYKVFEPVLLVGNDKFKDVDIRVKVRGGGNTSQIFGEHFFFLRCAWCVWTGEGSCGIAAPKLAIEAARSRQDGNTGVRLALVPGRGEYASRVPNFSA